MSHPELLAQPFFFSNYGWHIISVIIVMFVNTKHRYILTERELNLPRPCIYIFTLLLRPLAINCNYNKLFTLPTVCHLIVVYIISKSSPDSNFPVSLTSVRIISIGGQIFIKNAVKPLSTANMPQTEVIFNFPSHEYAKPSKISSKHLHSRQNHHNKLAFLDASRSPDVGSSRTDTYNRGQKC